MRHTRPCHGSVQHTRPWHGQIMVGKKGVGGSIGGAAERWWKQEKPSAAVFCYPSGHAQWSCAMCRSIRRGLFAMRRDTRSGLFAMRRNMPSCLFAMRRDTHSGLFSKCRTCTVVFLLYTGTQTHTRGRVRGARCRRIFAMHRDCLLAHHPGPWAAQEQTIAAQKAHCTAKTQ